MAKQRRPAKRTTAKRARAVKPPGVRTKPARGKPAAKKSPARTAAPREAALRKTVPSRPKRSVAEERETAAAPGPAAPTARKPGFYEAVAIYERGVQALQRHDFEAA